MLEIAPCCNLQHDSWLLLDNAKTFPPFVACEAKGPDRALAGEHVGSWDAPGCTEFATFLLYEARFLDVGRHAEA
jgi:hypothetical protein